MNDSTIPLKTCTNCNNSFPATTANFYKMKRGKYGLDSICISCKKAKRRERHAANPDYEREYRIANRDKLNHYLRQYRAINRDKIRAYYVANHDKMRLRYRRYRLTKPEVSRAIGHRRRARKLALPATLTMEQWNDCLGYFNGGCAVCGRQPSQLHTIAQDHWIPLSKGGAYTARNIVPLCHALKDGTDGCNNSKSDKLPETWLIQKYGQVGANEILRRINEYFERVKTRS